MNSTILKYLGFLFCFFLLSCSSDKDNGLKKKIREYSKNEIIDDKEWSDLLKTAQGTEYENCTELKEYVQNLTKRKGAPKMPDCKDQQNSKINISIFIENSGSMSGYFNGATSFKNVLMEIPSRFQRDNCTSKYYFITKTPKPISDDYQGYIKKLDEGPKHIELNESHIDNLIATIANYTVKNNEITLLASDFIYDIGKKLPGDQLPVLQHSITNHLQNYLQNGDYAVLVLKMKSNFDGQYFSYKGLSVNVSGIRPYYIWLFGKTDQLLNIYKKYNLYNLEGLEDYVFLYSDKRKPVVFYSILTQTSKVGSFQREKSSKNNIHTIENVKKDKRKNIFQFSVAIDLDEIPAHKEYLLDKTNYQVLSDGKDNFEIVSIQPITKVVLHKNDKKYQGSSTHIITVKSNSISEPKQNVKIKLLRQIPEWIYKNSTNDDLNINQQMDKTFGLEYVMNGLFDAYILKGSKPSYVEFMFTIAK